MHKTSDKYANYYENATKLRMEGLEKHIFPGRVYFLHTLSRNLQNNHVSISMLLPVCTFINYN